MNNEKPTWELKDTPKSLYGVLGLAKVALATLLEKIDTKFADRVNGPDDAN